MEVKEHIQSALPAAQSSGQLDMIRAALKVAEDRYAWLMGHCPNNAMALRDATRTIKQYERQIAELTSEDWLK
jgi:hypothetical protein